MPRLDPDVLDACKSKAIDLRNAAIGETIRHIMLALRQFKYRILDWLSKPIIAPFATTQHQSVALDGVAMPYLHLVIAHRMDPNLRRLIASHTDALLVDILGIRAGATIIRIDGTPPDHWFPVGLEGTSRQTTVHAEFVIASGYIGQSQKASLTQALYAFFQDVFGTLAHTSRIAIRETPAHECFPYRPNGCDRLLTDTTDQTR